MAVEQRDGRVWSPEGPDQGKEIDVNTAATAAKTIAEKDDLTEAIKLLGEFINSRRSVNHLLGKEFAGFEVYKILFGNLWGQAIRDVYTLLYRIAALPGVVKGLVQRRWQNTKARGRAAKDKTKIKLESAKVRAKAKLKEGWQTAKAKLPNFKLAEQSKVRKFFNTSKQKGKGLVARVLRGRSKEGSNKGRSKGILARTIGLLSKPLEGIAGLFAKFKAMNAQRKARKNAVLRLAEQNEQMLEKLNIALQLLEGQTKAIEELSETLAELFGDRSTDGRPTEGKLRISRRREDRRLPGPSNKDFGGPWSRGKGDQPRQMMDVR